MNTLKRNNIVLDWLLAYVGVKKNWLSPKDVLETINFEDLDKVDESIISELYVAVDEPMEVFLNLIKRIGCISNEVFKIGLWVWSISYLNDIFKSDKGISEKLRDIDNVWVMVDYPENWKDFIYYMPVSEGEETGEDKLYKKFVEFLELENTKLREQGYLRSNRR
jgi:hypothetical protein